MRQTTAPKHPKHLENISYLGNIPNIWGEVTEDEKSLKKEPVGSENKDLWREL